MGRQAALPILGYIALCVILACIREEGFWGFELQKYLGRRASNVTRDDFYILTAAFEHFADGVR
jgi:hypothetical protein